MTQHAYSSFLGKALAATITMGLSVGASAATAQDAGLTALYNEAKAAGETTVSVYMPAVSSYRDLFTQFEKQFPGIKVAPTDLSGAALFSRLEAEAASGTSSGADVISTGELDFGTLSAKGYLESFKPVGIEEIPAELVGKDSSWFVWQIVPIGPAVNTSQITKEAPHKWADLLDPAYKDRIAMTSATTLTVAPLGMAQAMEGGAIDETWIKSFAAQKPAITSSTSATVLSVAQGQYSIAPFMALSVLNAAKAKGAPIDFWYLQEGNPVVPLSAGLMKTAPHPNAGKLYISWLLSKEAGDMSATSLGAMGTRRDAMPPAGMPEGHKLFVLTGDKLKAQIDAWMSGPATFFAP